MKEIKMLVEFIEEELEDAEKYAKLARKYEDKEKVLSDTLMELSRQELKHSEMLHGVVVSFITRARAEHVEPPASMMAVYEFMHERAIEKAAKVRSLHTKMA